MTAPRATIASELTMNDEAQYTVAHPDDLPNSPSLPLPPSLVVLKVSDSRLLEGFSRGRHITGIKVSPFVAHHPESYKNISWYCHPRGTGWVVARDRQQSVS